MTVSYKKLWKLLIDRDMMKKDLQREAGISWASVTKMSKGEVVGTEILMKVCKTLHCDIGDIVEFIDEDRKIVTDKFKAWCLDGFTEPYSNRDGFCYSATKAEVVEKDYSLVPSRYIAFDAEEEEIDYGVRMKELQLELKELMDQEQASKKALMEVLEGLGYGIS